MRSLLRRSATPLALTLAITLAGAACSSSSTTTTPSGGTTPGGSTAPAAMDYSTLSGTIAGSGSTFQASFNEAVIDAMKDAAPDLNNSYAGGGSGKGKTDLQGGLVDYAGTDSLVKDEDKAKYKGAFLYFPTVAAPITVSYNLGGVDKVNMSASTLAKVFQATITKWNDPVIVAENSGVTLPDKNIVVVHRADGSGTTNTFTKYLTAATPDWTLGTGDTVQWPASTQQGQGNGGVAQAVKTTEGAIGYVDFSDAKASGLKFVSLKNKAGKYVQPSVEAASAAMAKATIADNLTYSALDTDGPEAYPIVASTYILVYAAQTDATKGKAVKGFLTYTLNEGQDLAAAANFAKLTPELRAKANAQLTKITVP